MAVKLGGAAGNVTLTQQMMKGDDGGYYYPSIDENSNLSWTASEEGMPAVETVNIKGIQGIQGEKGDKGDQGPAGEQGVQGPKGDTGEKGDTGVYVGTEEPTDDSVLVWLNPEGDPSEGTTADVDLSNYYTKTETDEYFATIGYVDDAIADIDVPEVDLSNYYTKAETDELVANVSVDLSGYYTKEEIDAMLPTSSEGVGF